MHTFRKILDGVRTLYPEAVAVQKSQFASKTPPGKAKPPAKPKSTVVQSPILDQDSDNIIRYDKRVGEVVKKDDVVAEISSTWRAIKVRATTNGVIDKVFAIDGSDINNKQDLFSIRPVEDGGPCVSKCVDQCISKCASKTAPGNQTPKINDSATRAQPQIQAKEQLIDHANKVSNIAPIAKQPVRKQEELERQVAELADEGDDKAPIKAAKKDGQDNKIVHDEFKRDMNLTKKEKNQQEVEPFSEETDVKSTDKAIKTQQVTQEADVVVDPVIAKAEKIKPRDKNSEALSCEDSDKEHSKDIKAKDRVDKFDDVQMDKDLKEENLLAKNIEKLLQEWREEKTKAPKAIQLYKYGEDVSKEEANIMKHTRRSTIIAKGKDDSKELSDSEVEDMQKIKVSLKPKDDLTKEGIDIEELPWDPVDQGKKGSIEAKGKNKNQLDEFDDATDHSEKDKLKAKGRDQNQTDELSEEVNSDRSKTRKLKTKAKDAEEIDEFIEEFDTEHHKKSSIKAKEKDREHAEDLSEEFDVEHAKKKKIKTKGKYDEETDQFSEEIDSQQYKKTKVKAKGKDKDLSDDLSEEVHSEHMKKDTIKVQARNVDFSEKSESEKTDRHQIKAKEKLEEADEERRITAREKDDISNETMSEINMDNKRKDKKKKLMLKGKDVKDDFSEEMDTDSVKKDKIKAKAYEKDMTDDYSEEQVKKNEIKAKNKETSDEFSEEDSDHKNQIKTKNVSEDAEPETYGSKAMKKVQNIVKTIIINKRRKESVLDQFNEVDEEHVAAKDTKPEKTQKKQTRRPKPEFEEMGDKPILSKVPEFKKKNLDKVKQASQGSAIKINVPKKPRKNPPPQLQDNQFDLKPETEENNPKNKATKLDDRLDTHREIPHNDLPSSPKSEADEKPTIKTRGRMNEEEIDIDDFDKSEPLQKMSSKARNKKHAATSKTEKEEEPSPVEQVFYTIISYMWLPAEMIAKAFSKIFSRWK